MHRDEGDSTLEGGDMTAWRTAASLGALLVSAAGGLNDAAAEITRIEITSVESPTFGGREFGGVGAYEKLHGRAYGAVDPALPQNAVITDIDLAPRNADGRVEYSMDIFILKPIDLSRGNHRLLLDMNNRGEMRVGRLNDAALSNDPTTAADAGHGFVMDLGYTIVGNGWDFGASEADGGLTISVPVARKPDGSEITGPSYEYIVFNGANSGRFGLAFPAADLDQARATLTVRERLEDSAVEIPADRWAYVDATTIGLLPAGTPFERGHIYEFTYTAKDPVVAALGLAATRDFVSFLRHAPDDREGTSNPLAGDVRHTFSFSISQPSRALHDFQTYGFNADEQGRRVIDGMLKWTGAGTGDQINYRFGQTRRTERNRQNHLYPEGVFPFAHQVMRDHLSGKVDGRIVRCRDSDTCAKIFEANSSNEYWVKAGSLLHSDTRGRDLEDPEDVRYFLVSGTSHGVGAVDSRGACQQLLNPTSPFPALRALLVALDQWVSDGVEPPGSRIPRHADATATMAHARLGFPTGRVPQDELGWPAIPGVTYTGLITSRYHHNFGPDLDEHGIISNYPPSLADRPAYPIFVSKVDHDGNEIAGIRLPPVAAPIATTTGWALRRDGLGLNDGCEGSGQYIPFAKTKAERTATGDPRPSLEERYGSHETYVQAVTDAARSLVEQRLLLDEDAQRYIDEAARSDVLR
jgi:hypothetical protein